MFAVTIQFQDGASMIMKGTGSPMNQPATSTAFLPYRSASMPETRLDSVISMLTPSATTSTRNAGGYFTECTVRDVSADHGLCNLRWTRRLKLRSTAGQELKRDQVEPIRALHTRNMAGIWQQAQRL